MSKTTNINLVEMMQECTEKFGKMSQVVKGINSNVKIIAAQTQTNTNNIKNLYSKVAEYNNNFEARLSALENGKVAKTPYQNKGNNKKETKVPAGKVRVLENKVQMQSSCGHCIYFKTMEALNAYKERCRLLGIDYTLCPQCAKEATTAKWGEEAPSNAELIALKEMEKQEKEALRLARKAEMEAVTEAKRQAYLNK